jgi:hypothetical protein
MTRAILLISAIVSIGSFSALAGQVDPRFDGKWVGLEKFSYRHYSGNTITVRAPETVIGIAEHGKLVGVLAGWATGRYAVSPESRGNTLIYRMAGTKQSSANGREECKLVLSRDGNTIEETGHATVSLGTKDEATTRCQVSATFHRQEK